MRHGACHLISKYKPKQLSASFSGLFEEYATTPILGTWDRDFANQEEANTVLGGSWDSVTTYSWPYRITYTRPARETIVGFRRPVTSGY